MSHQLWERIPYTLINVSNDAADLYPPQRWWNDNVDAAHTTTIFVRRVRRGPSKHNMLWNMEFMWNLLRHIMMSEWEIENWESSRMRRRAKGKRIELRRAIMCVVINYKRWPKGNLQRDFSHFSVRTVRCDWAEKREEIPPLLVIVGR